MKRKLLLIILATGLLLSGCGEDYDEAVGNGGEESVFGGYFTVITEWGAGCYMVVYANDTKVKYLIDSVNRQGGITPLYNSDGSLQIYEGE